jgi:hypothetical protein
MSITVTRPVVTRIESELFDRLQKLCAGTSDYTRIVEVIRPKRLSGYTPKDRQIVLTREAKERVSEIDCPGNPPAEGHRAVFAIRCHIMPSEKDTTPVEEYCDIIESDVKRAVGDANLWHTMGGLAINSEWMDPIAINSDGSFDGVAVMIAVTFRTDENNPYNVRA